MTATTHSVTNRQTDGHTDDTMMPIAGHTVWHYDRLMTKEIITTTVLMLISVLALFAL